MLNQEQVVNFVEKGLLSGEELVYLSKVSKPKSGTKHFLVFLSVLCFLAAVILLVPDSALKSNNQERLLIVGAVTLTLSVFYLFWKILFYKKSSRQVVATTNLRFLIYQYPIDVFKLSEERLENYEFVKEITFDSMESMKLTEDKEDRGVLAMIFDEENEEKNGYITAKLHLEIDDCSKLREAIPDRMRPEGTKEDYWERTYED